MPSVVLAIAFFIFQTFGAAYTTLIAYFLNVVLCEVSCCFYTCIATKKADIKEALSSIV